MMTLYHGTSVLFAEFSSEHVGSRHLDLEVGPAFYFSNDLKTATWYANSAAAQTGGQPRLLRVALDLTNPLKVDFQGAGIEFLAEEIEKAKRLGCDGLIAYNYDDGEVSDHVIAFSSNQVAILQHETLPLAPTH